MMSGSLGPRLTLGGRLSAMYQVGAGWRRYFAQGIAVVNPSTSTLVVSLDGTYVNSAGRPVNTVTLGPASGAILRAPQGGGTGNG